MKFNTANVVVPGRRVRPAGYYDMQVLSLEKTKSKSGLLMFVVELAVMAPSQYASSRTVMHYFVLGKNAWEVNEKTPASEVEYVELDDPKCESELTFSKRGGKLLGFAQSMQWERAHDEEIDLDMLCADVSDATTPYTVGARLVVRTEEGGEYDGSEKNDVAFFYAIGTHEAAIDQPKGAKTAVKSGARTAANRAPRTNRTRAASSTED
jgi:hypothetical protein